MGARLARSRRRTETLWRYEPPTGAVEESPAGPEPATWPMGAVGLPLPPGAAAALTGAPLFPVVHLELTLREEEASAPDGSRLGIAFETLRRASAPHGGPAAPPRRRAPDPAPDARGGRRGGAPGGLPPPPPRPRPRTPGPRCPRAGAPGADRARRARPRRAPRGGSGHPGRSGAQGGGAAAPEDPGQRRGHPPGPGPRIPARHARGHPPPPVRAQDLRSGAGAPGVRNPCGSSWVGSRASSARSGTWTSSSRGSRGRPRGWGRRGGSPRPSSGSSWPAARPPWRRCRSPCGGGGARRCSVASSTPRRVARAQAPRRPSPHSPPGRRRPSSWPGPTSAW